MFVTYNFCTTVCYTAMNIPYGTLASLMSREQYERDMLSIYRKGIAPFGRILGVSCTLPLVKVFGGDQAAWIKTMCLWAAIAILLSLFCFVKCEEKVHIAAKKEQKVPLKKSLKALFTNKYFYAGTCFQLFESMVLAITGTMLPYYCKYVFHNDSWLYSAMYFVETGLMIFISMIICPKLLKRYGKRTISLFGVFFALAGHMIVFVNPYSVELIIASCIIRGIGFAPINAVFYGFIAEAVEYGQWKSHVRQEGMVYAGCTMGMKFGSGLTSLVLTGLLSLGGYISSTGADIVQPASAIDMIINIYKFGPIIMWIAYIILLLLYKLEKRYPIIIQELEEREARGEL